MKNQGFVNRLDLLIDEYGEGKKSKFSDFIGLHSSYIARWHNQGQLPSAEHLKRIAEATGKSIDWLLTGKGPRYLKESPDIKAAKSLAEYRTSEEREYIDKLVTIIRTKQDGTVLAIKQNLDAFLTTPDKNNEKKTNQGK